MITPLLDTCISCGRQASKPGDGICLQCEIRKAISDGVGRLRAGIAGSVKVTGKRLQPTVKKSNGYKDPFYEM